VFARTLVLDCMGAHPDKRPMLAKCEQTRTCKAQRCATSNEWRLPCVTDVTEEERRGKRDEDRRSAHHLPYDSGQAKPDSK
jgi:hypothetical protein